MSLVKFEEKLPGFSFVGEVNLEEGPSTGGFDGDLTVQNIVQSDQEIRFRFHWHDSGPLKSVLAAANCQYICNVYLERYGGGESTLPPAISPQNTTVQAVSQHYDQLITIPPNTLAPGIIKVICAMTMRFPGPPAVVPLPLAAYVEMGVLEIYRA